MGNFGRMRTEPEREAIKAEISRRLAVGQSAEGVMVDLGIGNGTYYRYYRELKKQWQKEWAGDALRIQHESIQRMQKRMSSMHAKYAETKDPDWLMKAQAIERDVLDYMAKWGFIDQAAQKLEVQHSLDPFDRALEIERKLLKERLDTIRADAIDADARVPDPQRPGAVGARVLPRPEREAP